ncbi:glutamate receptor ionotropic, kainate glr-3-like [Lycorma delicatula]|uniref:glutamate receptor ionotropic, kainate glr-3-like n=1 Tax=Lycorma delicatula TaxID=130591 RepID=UPI003F510061
MRDEEGSTSIHHNAVYQFGLYKASNDRLFNIRTLWLIVDTDELIRQNRQTIYNNSEEQIDSYYQYSNNTSSITDRLIHLNILPDSQNREQGANGNQEWARDGNRGLVAVENKEQTVDRNDCIVSEHDTYSEVEVSGGGENVFVLTNMTDSNDIEWYELYKTKIMHPEYFEGLESLGDLRRSYYDTYPKMYYQITQNMAKYMNFTLDIQIMGDYGWKNNNGSFSGLMGLLQRGEIDLAATGIFLRHDRLDIIDFTAENFALKTAVLFRQPPLSSLKNIYTLPFSTSVWISCGVLCILIILIWILEFKLGKKHSRDWSNPLDILTLVSGSIFQQGYPVWPTSTTAKIILFSVSLVSLFLYTSYSATVVALLQSSSKAIITLTDLVKSPLTVGVHDMTYNRVNFKESVDSEVKSLYQHKVLPKGQDAFMKPSKGINNVRKGLFAFQVEVDQGYKLISDTFDESEKCGLSEVRLFRTPSLALPVIKRSCYRELFTRQLRWQREVGIMNRIERLWLPQKPSCGSRGGGDYVRVGLSEFHPVLLILLYGMILGASLLVMEIIYYHRSYKGDMAN